MTDIEVPVLIVGGSLVGMTEALLLGHHGVRLLVVAHHRGTAIHPRAASVTQRTMEIFRSVGLDCMRGAIHEHDQVEHGRTCIGLLAGGRGRVYLIEMGPPAPDGLVPSSTLSALSPLEHRGG